MKKIVLFIVVCVVSAVVFEYGFLYMEEKEIKGVGYDRFSAKTKEIKGETTEVQRGIVIPGCTSIKLPANSKTAQVVLKNPDDNEGYYDLTYTLVLSENDETIFSTGLIPPGEVCTKVNLVRELEKGEYEASILVQPYRINEPHTSTNNAMLKVRLVVE